MRRILLYCLKLAALVALAVWLAESPGAVVINWHGWRLETNVALLLLLVLALTAALYGLLRFWRLLLAGPRGWRRRRQQKAREAALSALTDGLVAVAAGDGAAAKAAARKTFAHLGNRQLALLLTAQAALLEEEEDEARRSFEAMLDLPQTAFLGHKGLAAADLKEGRTGNALSHVRKALALKPKSRWALGAMVELSARTGDWRALSDSLEPAARVLPPEDISRYRQLAVVGAAQQALEQGDTETAALAADTALRQQPGDVAALLVRARTWLALHKPAKALSLIEKHWAEAAHPELGRVYQQALADLPPLQAASRGEALVKAAPDRAEGHLVAASLALTAGLWGEARRHLRAAEADPARRRRTYGLFAELEEAEHRDIGKADGWRVKALAEPSVPDWRCTACGTAADRWAPACPQCHAPGTLMVPMADVPPVISGGSLTLAPASAQTIAPAV
jgi:HemY protein